MVPSPDFGGSVNSATQVAERNPDYVSKCQNLSDFAHHGKEVAQIRIDPGFELSALRKDHRAPPCANAQLASRSRLRDGPISKS